MGRSCNPFGLNFVAQNNRFVEQSAGKPLNKSILLRKILTLLANKAALLSAKSICSLKGTLFYSKAAKTGCETGLTSAFRPLG